MSDEKLTRRTLLRTTVVATAKSAAACARPARKAIREERVQTKVAGYDYDRVRGIINGRCGIRGANHHLGYEDIYAINDLALGAEQALEVRS